MKVVLVGYTTANTQNMHEATGERWYPEGDGDAGDLIEFAGRACYESWDRPNPDTATNVGYIQNLTRAQHLSVLEHGVLSFYITDVSRSLTHELVRHRHFSYSQVSQRYVNPVDTDTGRFVIPPLLADSDAADYWFRASWDFSTHAYSEVLKIAERRAEMLGVEGRMAKKMAREAARAVLPNMTPTAIVVTGNHRSWLEFFAKRGTIHADQEIRALACELLRQCKQAEPNVYHGWDVVPVAINSFHTEVIQHDVQ